MKKGYAIKFDSNGPYIELTDDQGAIRRFSVKEFKDYLDKDTGVKEQEIPEFYLELQKVIRTVTRPNQNN